PSGNAQRDRAAALEHIRLSVESLLERRCGAKLGLAQMKKHSVTAEDIRSLFPSARFLIIYRKSRAEQFVSRETARKTEEWYRRGEKHAEEPKIKIEKMALKEFYDFNDADYRALIALPWMRERAVLFSYEELAADPQRLFDEVICPFLGIPPFKVKSEMVKQGRKSIEERVKNFDEVKDLLTGDAAWVEYRFP
ncbi:sulfotransferase, partial [Candidatus Sumerlaeota bacterium]|nr:sulfotransferase [Candidatus Sumerlaeota bacterium]